MRWPGVWVQKRELWGQLRKKNNRIHVLAHLKKFCY